MSEGVKDNVIFWGHFQPFHNGHVDALKQICEMNAPIHHLFFAVATSDVDNVRDNPFSFGLFLNEIICIILCLSSLLLHMIDG